MNITLSVSVMAVPERRNMVRENLVPILPESTYISYDINHKGIWWNSRNCWSHYSSEATHHLVIQDDALPCNNFIEHVQEILSINNDNIICFYLGNAWTSKINTLLKNNRHWLVRDCGVASVALIIPTKWIPDMLVFGERYFSKSETMNEDNRIACWQYIRKHPTWYPIPELVDHIGNGKSVIGHGSKNNFAGTFLKNYPQTDWTQGLSSPIIYKSHIRELQPYINKYYKP